MPKLYIIIPCYNEEGNIKELLNEIEVLTNSNTSFEWKIVVVNDCSTDKTSSEANEYKNTVVLNLPVNLGVGGAVQTGLIYAANNKADYAIKVDGDGQHDPADIKSLLEPLIDNKADIVIGSRNLSEKEGFKSTFFRRLGSKILQFLCRILTSQTITDPTSGFRAYNKKAIEFMNDNYPSFDYPEPEEVVLACENGFKLVEVPVKMRERKKGTSSISFYGSFYYMFKVILSMIFIKIRK